MKRVCLSFLLLVCSACCLYRAFMLQKERGGRVECVEGQMILLEKDTEYYCNMVSENVGYCDIPAYGRMIAMLMAEGYVVERVESREMEYDYILSRSEVDKYRLYMGRDGRVTSIAYRYEDSGVPFTYINEEE